MLRPYTFINIAMTADGKIDTVERKGSAISSKRDKERVDQLRAAADGIAGAGGVDDDLRDAVEHGRQGPAAGEGRGLLLD